MINRRFVFSQETEGETFKKNFASCCSNVTMVALYRHACVIEYLCDQSYNKDVDPKGVPK